MLAVAIVWYLDVDATTVHVTRAEVSAPAGLDSGADAGYVEELTVAIGSSEVRRATAEATGMPVDQIFSRLRVAVRTDPPAALVEDRATRDDPVLAASVITSAVESAHAIAVAPPTPEELRPTIARVGEQLDQLEEFVAGSMIGSPALVTLDQATVRVRAGLTRQQVATTPDPVEVGTLTGEARAAVETALADPLVAGSDLELALTSVRDDLIRLATSVTTVAADAAPRIEIGSTSPHQTLQRPFAQAVLTGLVGAIAFSLVAIAWEEGARRRRFAPSNLDAVEAVSVSDRLEGHVGTGA